MYIAYASVLLLRCTYVAHATKDAACPKKQNLVQKSNFFVHLLAQENTKCSVRPVGFAARVFLVLATGISTAQQPSKPRPGIQKSETATESLL